jgi:D-serine deaminase-like pyridoxal phosphate-dependent protein
MVEANQEHGIISSRSAGDQAPKIAVGEMVRILPNHACATGAQHDRYYVLSNTGDEIVAEWPRLHGW